MRNYRKLLPTPELRATCQHVKVLSFNFTAIPLQRGNKLLALPLMPVLLRNNTSTRGPCSKTFYLLNSESKRTFIRKYISLSAFLLLAKLTNFNKCMNKYLNFTSNIITNIMFCFKRTQLALGLFCIMQAQNNTTCRQQICR